MGKTKICKYCRSEIDQKATICPNCRKRQQQKGAVPVLIIGLIAVIIIMSVGMNHDNTSISNEVSNTVDEVTITLDEYNQIADGMTVEEVTAIVGGSGTIQSESEVAGIKSQVICWYGSNVGSDAVITFSDGKVIGKAQVNLK